ncbi:MAG: hypothetical protein ACLQQ4_00410 [Bacteroidia bacterium]
MIEGQYPTPKELYEALVFIRDKENRLIQVVFKFKENNVLDKLKSFHYIDKEELTTPEFKQWYCISEKGLMFMEYYETIKERKETNKYLIWVAIPAAIYYIIEIAKIILTTPNLWGFFCHY